MDAGIRTAGPSFKMIPALYQIPPSGTTPAPPFAFCTLQVHVFADSGHTIPVPQVQKEDCPSADKYQNQNQNQNGNQSNQNQNTRQNRNTKQGRANQQQNQNQR